MLCQSAANRKITTQRKTQEKAAMTLTQPTKATQAVQTTFSLLSDLLAFSSPRRFAVRLWDGTIWEPEPGQPPLFTLVLQHPGALRSMFLPPSELALGEAYIFND